MERHLLPDSPTLDTTRTLDYSIASDLNGWLAGKSGVWVVLWQDDVVDPVGYLPVMLQQAGEELPVDKTSPGAAAPLPTRTGARFSDQPKVEHPSGINFGDKLMLLGYSQTGPQQVTFFWKAVQPLTDDLRVSIILRDTNNQIWGSGTAGLLPTSTRPSAGG